ncbi:permease [Algoriphagus sp. H41]|uniref:Permease n=1 Tax=Algoriphagus oliviformis TaxID=2811231 RepID=A0ABS3C4H7_9BACT|nr:permease [Algoriphagus oliviformis]MBN7811066.1 permease [Algoriphagus oliviformis]
MSIALEKTLSLILLIGIGVLLQQKFQSEDQKKGLKTLILTLALPAMIFVALMKIEINPDLLFLPVLALGFNLVMMYLTRFSMPAFGIKKDSAEMRTLALLVPSLAPGLTCFPFVAQYLGDDLLAWSALADIGNKIFVLILAYMLAMSWYYKTQQLPARSNRQKIKELLLAMLSEPINVVILAAIILLSFGLHMDDLPGFLSASILMLKDVMTPLVLLFIGIAVMFKWSQIKTIFALLVFRAGFTFLLSGLFLWLIPGLPFASALLVVVFPQSAVSFWPFAHMSAIRKMEINSGSSKATFDLDLGINVLAVSMPLSTLMILGVFTSGNLWVVPTNVLILGASLVGLSLAPTAVKLLAANRKTMISEEEGSYRDLEFKKMEK